MKRGTCLYEIKGHGCTDGKGLRGYTEGNWGRIYTVCEGDMSILKEKLS